MARSCCRLSLLLILLPTLASLTSAYDFYVGGRDGWVLNPSESYNSWAGKMRFRVNDKLVFIYKKGEDSVLQVTKEAYDSCNRSKPIRLMDNGDSIFQLDRSGPFYFISGRQGRCEQGQKLTVVVMTVGHHTPKPMAPAPGPPKAPAPGPASPTVPTPASSPTKSPAPSAGSPTTSPGGSGGVSPPAAGPANNGPGAGEGRGPPATPGSASSVMSVSRVFLAVALFVIGAVLVG